MTKKTGRSFDIKRQEEALAKKTGISFGKKQEEALAKKIGRSCDKKT